MDKSLQVYTVENGFVVRPFNPDMHPGGQGGPQHVFRTSQGLADHIHKWALEIKKDREPPTAICTTNAEAGGESPRDLLYELVRAVRADPAGKSGDSPIKIAALIDSIVEQS